MSRLCNGLAGMIMSDGTDDVNLTVVHLGGSPVAHSY